MADEQPVQPFRQGSMSSADNALRREEMLRLLRESLAEWESRVNWETLPETRRAALNTLAEESASTLRELIRNFEERASRQRRPGPKESPDARG
jgi:hypothetical protein